MPPTLAGYVVMFNTPSRPLGSGWREVIAPGAFARSIRRDKIIATWRHDRTQRLGSNRDCGLRLWEDARGLRFELRLPNNRLGRVVAALARRGWPGGMSFTFTSRRVKWRWVGGEEQRVVHEARLSEICLALIPAYPDTAAWLVHEPPDLSAEIRQGTWEILDLAERWWRLMEKT